MPRKPRCAAKRHQPAPEGLGNGLWQCADCRRWWHWWCSGADDSVPNVCDECWKRCKLLIDLLLVVPVMFGLNTRGPARWMRFNRPPEASVEVVHG